MKKVSVIIPVYAVEQYIADALQSVLSQSYQNFEIILVDDGTPDNSIKICKQFTDPRIKIIQQKNRGASAARNNGIRHAQGEYIAFLDADDTWVSEKLEKHINHLEKSPNVGVSFSYCSFIDEAGKPLGLYNATEYKVITPEAILCRNPIANPSCLVTRREVLEEIKFQQEVNGLVEDCYFDESLRQSEDAECWLRICVKTNWKIEVIPELLATYRLHSIGNSANLVKTLESWEQLTEKARLYAPESVAKWEKPAMAYTLRYLARKAVTMSDGAMAIKLSHKAISTHWQILLEEPRRTLVTLTAAYLLYFLPQPFYTQIKNLGLKFISANQRRRILKDQSRQKSQAVISSSS
ncbi:glycosyltransferase family 2 protein [Chroogloeocystis siderophila]|jgi:glycosyltransferase involved in cell wall biosynthesis|uniref:Glucosyl transferase n=1 Tax=Chroogloeocystis siderophila 5.2 s.c.1 TaxID=247279 RepID=A0A1U7HVS5_9CHRO|nr:glycosyltransferase family 2 protein [Chroogloeocystis siderophila]OKH27679.1 glucosyl transferase [Chroogloeocystis siderophila 5.2 s.c.1]